MNIAAKHHCPAGQNGHPVDSGRRFGAVLRHARAVLFAATALLGQGSPAIAAPTIDYIGNAGIMITADEDVILIDPFVPHDYGRYEVPAPEDQAALAQALPPFDRVRLILITHEHPDHFDAQALRLHLQSNLRATVVLPAALGVHMIESDSTWAAFADRVEGVRPQEPSTLSAGSIQVTAFPTQHVSANYSHLAHLSFLVECEDARILHFGDASPSASGLATLAFVPAPIDAAILPPWLLEGMQPCKAIRDLPVSHWIVVHLTSTQVQSLSGHQTDERLEFFGHALSVRYSINRD